MECEKLLSLPTILFLVSILILILNFFSRNNNFFDVRGVFKQHFAIFLGAPFQIVVFFITPLLISIGIVLIKTIDKDIINNINIVLSIFISMFFAMLSILTGIEKKAGNNSEYNDLLKETFNTIIFENILCLVILVISFVQLFINDYTVSLYLKIASFIIYYLIIVVVLNIFVVIKRVKVLFDNR